MLVNSMVIAAVIWLVGVSVKDFACALVGQYDFVDKEQQVAFNETMHIYLLRASLIALFVAALIYYVWMRRVLTPLRNLTKSMRVMAEGQFPDPIKAVSEDEIGQLSRHFNHMIAVLKQAEESRKQLFSDISHDLRTPLSNLNGYLEALSTGVIEGDGELYRSLHDESKQLTHLVDQLHQLAVLEGKKLEVQRVNVAEMIRSTVHFFELELKNANIDCQTAIAAGCVHADEAGLRQVLTNLLSNAVQYRTSNVIRITGEALSGKYRVTVTNEGEFIAPEQAGRIFERFYRIDASRNRDTGGSGLGLSIANEIIRQHGGEIGLASDGNKHSFWFELPLADGSV